MTIEVAAREAEAMRERHREEVERAERKAMVAGAADDAAPFTVRHKASGRSFPAMFVVADGMVHVALFAGSSGWLTDVTQLGNSAPGAEWLARSLANQLLRKEFGAL